MQAILFVDPGRCRMWELHDRLEWHITADTCCEEIESFRTHGQLLPVLARPLRGDPNHDYELIFGARRLFVARYTNSQLKLEVRDLRDREALIAMDIENRHRKDISPYERGMSYARWLRRGLFESQDDIARALAVSASQVSRLLKLAHLPSVVVDAFGSATEIRESWGLKLSEALEEPAHRQAIIRVARALGIQRPRRPANEVYRRILAAAADSRRVEDVARDEVVAGNDGEPLFRIRRLNACVSLMLPTERASDRVLDSIRRFVADVLQDASAQDTELTTKP